MIAHRNSFLGVAATALVLASVAPVRADVVGPYHWEQWLALYGAQPTSKLWLPDELRTFAPGAVVPRDTFAASRGINFELSGSLVKGTIGHYPNQLVTESVGVAVTVHWDSPITAVYYGAFGQLRVNLYRGETLLRSVWSPNTEAGFTASEPFDRMEFVTASDQYLSFAGLQWVVPAPAASALLVLCGAAPCRRRRA